MYRLLMGKCSNQDSIGCLRICDQDWLDNLRLPRRSTCQQAQVLALVATVLALAALALVVLVALVLVLVLVVEVLVPVLVSHLPTLGTMICKILQVYSKCRRH